MTPIEQQLAPPGGWHPAAEPRIVPLDPQQLRAPMRALLWVGGKFAARRTGMASVPAVFRLLMRHRGLFAPWLRFAMKLMPYGTLGRRETELVILRVAWNCRSRYEWGQHVTIALREGLSAAEIARIAQGPDAPEWAPLQAALLRATDELHRARLISAASWAALSRHFSNEQLIELAMLVGHYEMLAGLLNSVGLPLDAKAETQLAAADIHPR